MAKIWYTHQKNVLFVVKFYKTHIRLVNFNYVIITAKFTKGLCEYVRVQALQKLKNYFLPLECVQNSYVFESG